MEIFNRKSSGKNILGDISGNKLAETKKCLNCLKRVDVRFEKCPFCKAQDFLYNDT